MDDQPRRRTITLGYKRDAGEPAPICVPDEFVAEETPLERRIASAAGIPINEAMPERRHDDFLKRMANWRRTVKDHHGGEPDSFCATWARWYVMTRMLKVSSSPRHFVEPDPGTARPRITVDELDGWLVEATVRRLPVFEHRKVLQYWYVWQADEHWIKRRMMVRRSGVMLLKARAEASLKNMFTSQDSASNLLLHQFHAGNVPRPESTDALVGVVDSKESKASIE